ncbi:MAG: phage recombination protein Bet [Candidatus Micrarchaeia archaeon]
MLVKQKMNSGTSTSNIVDFPKYSRDQIELIKKTVARGATDDELALFLYRAKQLDLDPLSNQIYFVKRRIKNNKGGYDEIATIQVGIEGLRLIAERSGKYEGQDPIKYIVERNNQIIETEWVLPTDKPIAAKASVYKRGCVKPFTAVAHYNDYVVKNPDGTPNAMWRRWTIMLAKCAESLALRKAFPELNFSGIYEPAETNHIEENTTITTVDVETVESFEPILTETEPFVFETEEVSIPQFKTDVISREENEVTEAVSNPVLKNEESLKELKSVKSEIKTDKEIQTFKDTPKEVKKEKDNAPDVKEIFEESNTELNLITDSQINAIVNLAKKFKLDEKIVRDRIKGISYREAAEVIRQLGKKDISYFIEPF